MNSSVPGAQRFPTLAVVATAVVIIALIAFVFVSRGQREPDALGTDDAGVAHPQPVGVDDDTVSN